MTDLIPVGDPITSREQIVVMPIGTIMEVIENPEQWYRKIAEGEWSEHDCGRRTHVDGNFSLNRYNRVRSYPDGTLGETVQRYKWRFRQHALEAQRNNSSYAPMHVVDGALRRLGCDRFEVGAGLVVSSIQDLSALPEETLVRYGRPEQVTSFGLHVKRDHRWQHVFGGWYPLELPVTIERYPGTGTTPPDWWTATATESDAADIRAFKALAWKVGWRIKHDRDWCTTYEGIMRRFGITEADSDDEEGEPAPVAYPVGSRVSPGQARHLPSGTVLRWRHRTYPRARVAWFVRSDMSSNVAGTRRLFYYRDDGVHMGHSADVMEVMWVPGTDMSLDVGGLSAFPLLPAGTVFTLGAGVRYVMARRNHDRRVALAEQQQYRTSDVPYLGAYALTEFTDETIASLRVVSFPIGV